MDIQTLNQLSEKAFIDACQPLLEHCEWVLPKLANERPFADIEGMQNVLESIVRVAPESLQLAALRDHPKLGASQAQPGFSQSEQQKAGLGSLTADEFERFADLNERYEALWGYPFVVAVSGLDKTRILSLMEERLHSAKQEEWETALNELIKIAKIRVAKLISA